MALTLGYERFVRYQPDSSGATVLVGADGTTLYDNVNRTKSAVVKAHAGLGGSASTTAFTFHTSFLVPWKFYAVTPIVINGFGAVTGATASIAVGESAATPYTPTATPIACTLDGVTPFDVPAAPDATSETMLELDRVAISAVPRTDGGSGYIVMARIAQPAGQHDLRGAAIAPASATLDTHKHIAGYGSGDRTLTTISSYFNTGASVALRFHTDKPVTTFYAIGDSTIAGHLYETDNNAGSALSWAIADAQAAGEYVAFCNGGVAGQSLIQYVAREDVALNALSPDVACFCPFTPNTASSQYTTTAGLDNALLEAVLFIQKCAAAKITPVLVTACPNDGYTGATETARQAAQAALIALAANYGVTVADRSALFTAPAGGWVSGYSNDGIHPNKTAVDLEKTEVWAEIVSARGRP